VAICADVQRWAKNPSAHLLRFRLAC